MQPLQSQRPALQIQVQRASHIATVVSSQKILHAGVKQQAPRVIGQLLNQRNCTVVFPVAVPPDIINACIFLKMALYLFVSLD